jgi:hypothetical protein
MYRLITLLAASTALAGCMTTPAADLAPPPPVAEPAAARRRRPAPLRSSAPSASTRPAWTRRPAGRQFLRICQRHLGQEHADPGRQVQLRHVHQARRSVARAHRGLIEEAAKDPNSRIGAPMPASWTKRRSRRRAWRRSSRGSNQIRGVKRSAGCRALRRGQPDGRRHAVRRLRRPGRQGARPVYPQRSPSPASACPTATIICRRTPSWSRPRPNISPSDQHADAGRREECRRPRQGDPRLRDQDRQGSAGPASRAATRPRPTTR